MALLAGVLALSFLVDIDRVAVARGSLVGGSLAVRTPLTARVRSVAVGAGQKVRRGDLLLEFDVEQERAELRAAEARRAALLARLRGLERERARAEAEAHPDALEAARSFKARAHVDLEAARARLASLEQLGGEGLVQQLDVAAARLEYDRAQIVSSDAAAAIARLEREQAGELESLDSELEVEAASLTAEREIIAALARHTQQARLSTPADGFVLGEDTGLLAGRTFEQGVAVLRLSTEAPVRFEGFLADLERPKVVVGQAVKIRLDGYPWLLHGSARGVVERVADARDPVEGGFRVAIRVEASGAPGPLLDGMAGEARVLVGERLSLARWIQEVLLGRGG